MAELSPSIYCSVVATLPARTALDANALPAHVAFGAIFILMRPNLSLLDTMRALQHYTPKSITEAFIMAADEFLTTRQVAELLKLSEATVRKWCREGRLPAVKLGKSYRIRRSDLDRLFDQASSTTPPLSPTTEPATR